MVFFRGRVQATNQARPRSISIPFFSQDQWTRPEDNQTARGVTVPFVTIPRGLVQTAGKGPCRYVRFSTGSNHFHLSFQGSLSPQSAFTQPLRSLWIRPGCLVAHMQTAGMAGWTNVSIPVMRSQRHVKVTPPAPRPGHTHVMESHEVVMPPRVAWTSPCSL